MSWHSERQSSLVLDSPSDVGVRSHFCLQSETDLRNLGSFLVPETSLLSLGFCPGTFGDLPVKKIVSFAASSASAGCVL